MDLTTNRVKKELAILFDVKEETINNDLVLYVYNLQLQIEKLIIVNKEIHTKLDIVKDILDNV